jgi:hypothetical protein
MILDALTRLSDGLSVTDSDAYTDYSYDLASISPAREPGTGEPLALVFSVGVAASGSTDTTDLKVVTSTAAGLATSTIALVTRRIANALLTAGSKHVLPIPPGSVTQRYIGGRVELGSGDTITVDVDLVPMSFIGQNKAYADAVTWS